MEIWSRARKNAARTPADRDRFVDFLRAFSILMVITGHWVIAGFQWVDGTILSTSVLQVSPGSQWLTWLFQVMPVFFIVGGYANAASLQSARRRGVDYPHWFAGRLQRLLRPLLLLVGTWTVIAFGALMFGLAGESVQLVSRTGLIPIWFLAIYILVAALAPVTYGFWQRWPLGSILVPALVAIIVDVVSLATPLSWIGWSNYFWIFLAVHQAGYAWRTGRVPGPGASLLMSGAGWTVLVLLIFTGPYPLAMAGSPDPDISNTLPPRVPILALALAQFGLLLALRGPVRNWLENLSLWTATVLINSMIMTLYLWHVSVMLLVVAMAWLMDGLGLGFATATADWWLSRIPWVLGLYLLLVPVAVLLAPVEQGISKPGPRVPGTWRQVGGATSACLGIALLARFGIGDPVLPFLDVVAVVLVFLGALISGVFTGNDPSGSETTP